MNELMITCLENDWLLYAACGAAGAGGLIQLLLLMIYNRSLNASERMRSTKIAWLRQMKVRYESGYEWDNRIRNVELFVDKNIGRRKWMGIYLKTWEELSRVMLWVVLGCSVLGALCAGTYKEGTTMPVVYLVTGATLAMFLRMITVLVNLREKRCLLRINLCDYFENTLQGEAKNRRREHLREQEAYYGKEILREEIACAVADADDAKQGERDKGKEQPDKVGRMSQEVVKKEQVSGQRADRELQVEMESLETDMKKRDVVQSRDAAKKEKETAKSNKAVLQKERKKEKKLSRLAKKEVKNLKKQEKNAAKEAKRSEKKAKKAEKETKKLQRKQAKEQKRVDKLTKRMEKMQVRLGTAATSESAGQPTGFGGKKEENARQKREQLKRKVDVTPAQEDQIISEVLREFLA